MRSLHLVRHAETRQEALVSSHEWHLTDRGERQARDLAAHIRTLSLRRIITSEEPKAVRTARVISHALHFPTERRAGLGEHRRATAPYFQRPEEFHAAIHSLFSHPDEVVFGEESANAAHERFHRALTTLMDESEHDELVVTHGTVLSLLVSRANRFDTFHFWKSELAMPMLLTLRWPTLELTSTFVPESATKSAG